MKKRIICIFLALVIGFALVLPASANNTKLVALTFDDGPSATITPRLLDALDERNVKVSFFLVGFMLQANTDIAQRAFDSGHQLCNHTYNHPWFSKISLEEMKWQVSRNDELIEQITGTKNALLRIPYGDVTNKAKANVSTSIMQWSVDPTNGNSSTPEDKMYQNLIDTVKDGSIILLHDTSEKNLNVALRAIDELLSRGYEFVTLDELFRLRGVAPQAGGVYYSVPSGEQETAFDEANIAQHWAYDSLMAVKNLNIMTGSNSGLEPNNYMTRAMAVVVLERLSEALGKSGGIQNIAAEQPARFYDVPDGLWYTQAVNWASANDFISGRSDGRFDPDGYITKEEFYVLLARFAPWELAMESPDHEPAVYRDDVHIGSWAKSAIAQFRNAGFKSKNDPEVFRPADKITRAEAAELLQFVFDIVSGQPLMVTPDNAEIALGVSLCACSYPRTTLLSFSAKLGVNSNAQDQLS